MDLRLLELFTSLPRETPPNEAQLLALRVLSDEWISRDRAVGLLLAERLQHEVPEVRAVDLGLDPGLAVGDLRSLVLKAPEVRGLVAKVDDAQFAVRCLSWLLSAPEGEALHAQVATLLSSLLTRVELGELQLEPEEREGRYRLSNGWALDVFVRQHEFGRVDAMRSPDGFEVLLIDYARGPLATVRDYRPPTAVEHDVYGLGLRARRGRY